jgi:hypothetical protein
MQVYRLGKELDRKVYRFANGRELLGKEMLLELEELNGPRELRYRFIAKDMPVKAESSKKVEPAPQAADSSIAEPVTKDKATDNGARS